MDFTEHDKAEEWFNNSEYGKGRIAGFVPLLMADYAEYYHQNKVKTLGLFSVSKMSLSDKEMEKELYGILRKHKLPLKKREEMMVDLLNLFSVSGSALSKIKAISMRTLDMNLKNDIKDEYDRMDNALEEIWDICNNIIK